MIGSPISNGRASETLPVAPRGDVHAPLVMERLYPRSADEYLLDEANRVIELMRSLPPPWQRLISADFSGTEGQLIYERFVGVTLRDLCAAMRTTGRVIPLDVLRAVIDRISDGLALLPTGDRSVPSMHVSEQSIGLGLEGRWHFANGALNLWLINVLTHQYAIDLVLPLSPDTVLLMSPEGLQGRPETQASLVTRVALIGWQLCNGGYHPYRGGPHELMPSLSRYTRDEIRMPLTAHPELPPAVIEVLTRGIRFSRDRFVDLPAFRAALDAAWTQPAASPARTLDVIASLTWPTIQKELQLLKREPLLPIRWDGVWSGALTPEQGIAVLEDQLLERIEPLERFPKSAPVSETFDPEPAFVPNLPQPTPPRPGFFQRLLALFR